MTSLLGKVGKDARQVLMMDGGAIGYDGVWKPGLGDNGNR